MTPRLAVTQKQVDELLSTVDGAVAATVNLRLDQRPTMPCPDTLHVHRVPIPEGTEVRIEYPCGVCDGSGRGTLDGKSQDWLTCGECNGKGWHPVAFATLTEARKHLHDDGLFGWTVILTNLTPTEDQSDG